MGLIKKFLSSLLVTVLLFSTSIAIMPMRMVVFAQATNIYVNPSVVSGVMPPNMFYVNISVSDAPLSYAWELSIEWDLAVLNVSSVREGDFLHRWVWDPWEEEYVPAYETTILTYPVSLNDANTEGKLMVTCSLLGDVDWASGDGWLVEFGFKVKAQGSCLLNLCETSLYDHEEAGAPAPTFYPNNDGFFYNRTPPVHDIKLYDITVINPIVHRGEVANINITVLNEGTATESFTLNVYADVTLIGTTTVSSLSGSGNFEARSFTYELGWDTTDDPEGNYTISASVPPLSGEVDTADNTFPLPPTEIPLLVTFVSDITGPQDRPDGNVDNLDLSFTTQAYGKTSSEMNWSQYKIADTRGPTGSPDGKVDVRDLHYCGRQYGSSIP